MSLRDMAWTTAAAMGLGCAVTATLAAWLLLTNPIAASTALSAHDLGTLASTATAALQDVALRLLH
jgi:hypothetical protein